MRDLIDRQAAIDDVCKMMCECFGADEEELDAIEVTLHELPAVQPDHVADVSKKVSVSCGQENDLISRQAAIEAIVNTVSKIGLHDDSEVARYGATFRQHEIIDIIEGMPSAQPERKKGHWLRYGEDGYPNNEDTVFWQCDQCLEQYTGRAKKIPNFCPNCGADMREATHEQT